MRWKPFSSRIGRGTLKERFYDLAEALSEQGTLSDVTRSEGGFTLNIHTCPYHTLSGEDNAFCDMHREMGSRLVGCKVRANRRIAGGHIRCEFELDVGSE